MRSRGGGADRAGAVEALWRELNDQLVAFAIGLGLQPADACDVVADVFTGLLESDVDLATVEPGYLFRAVRNRASNFRRGHMRYKAAMEAWSLERPHRRPSVPDPHRVFERKHAADLLRDAITALPARQREVLAYRHLEGLSCDEIASELETTPGSVRQQLCRAHKGLRHYFLEQGVRRLDAI